MPAPESGGNKAPEPASGSPMQLVGRMHRAEHHLPPSSVYICGELDGTWNIGLGNQALPIFHLTILGLIQYIPPREDIFHNVNKHIVCRKQTLGIYLVLFVSC